MARGRALAALAAALCASTLSPAAAIIRRLQDHGTGDASDSSAAAAPRLPHVQPPPPSAALSVSANDPARRQVAATPSPANDAAYAAQQQAKLDRLTEWAVERGINMSAVKLVWSPEYGSHVVAAVPLAAKEAAVVVPASLVIDAAAVAATPVVGTLVGAMYSAARRVVAGEMAPSDALGQEQAVLINGDATNQHLALVAWAHYMRYYAPANVTAPLAPFLAVQPDAFPGLLAAYESSEAAAAAALSDVTHSLHHMREQEARVIAAVHDQVLLREPAVYGASTAATEARWASELVWAARVIATRCFGPKVSGGSVALYPVIDLVNHQPTALTTEGAGAPDASGAVVVTRVMQRTHQPIAVGEQVWGAYQTGPPGVCGFHMLSHYGFLAHHALEHCLRISVAIAAATPTDVLSVYRSATIAATGLMTNPAAGGSFDIVIQEGGAVPTLLTVVSRAMLLTFADAERVPPGWNATQVATLDNERRTVQHLLSQLQYLTDVRVGELEAAIKSGLLPADPAQRTVNEANMVAVVNGALSALEVARRRLVDHWTALLMVPDPCP